MFRFYAPSDNFSDNEVFLEKDDINHIKNVLRMDIGEKIIVCDGKGQDSLCEISYLDNSCVKATIINQYPCKAELPAQIILFQGLPKKDKMELIIQKAVELGVSKIVPVSTKNCVAKIEDRKKEAKKLERWRSIVLSAAKQSGRGIIPKICSVMSFKEAMEYAKELEGAIIPYEKAKGIEESKKIIKDMATKHSVGIFIGPEGGFDAAEIETAQANNIHPITLGNRILRTETAGLTVLSILMFEMEK